MTHKPIALANRIKPSSERTPGELSPEMITYYFSARRELDFRDIRYVDIARKTLTLRGSPSSVLESLSRNKPSPSVGLMKCTDWVSES